MSSTGTSSFGMIKRIFGPRSKKNLWKVSRLNICDPLVQNAVNFANTIAIIDGDQEITYKELEGRVRQTAGRLIAVGTTPGNRIGIALRDHADHVIAMLAVGRIGAVVLPLDWSARPQEKISLANRFETTLILVDEDA